MRGGDEYVLCGNPEFAFHLLRHVLPDLLGNPACVQRDEGRASRTTVDHDGAGIDVIENAFVVPGKFVLRGRHVDFGGACPKRCSLRKTFA